MNGLSKRMRVVFTISLVLNVLFIAVGAGLLYKFARDDIRIPPDMSPEARHFMARTFQEGREQVKPLIEQVKERRAVVREIITAEEFDADAYAEAIEPMLDTRDQISRKRAEIMGKALAELPLEDREKFADRILDGLEGRKKHKKGYHHKMLQDGKPPESPSDTR
jgi:hypothetical protein